MIRREPNVLIHVGGEWRSSGYYNVLAVLDEADWTEQDGQSHRRSSLAISFAALRTSDSHMVAADHQVLNLDAELAGSAHHSGFFRVVDRCHGMSALRDDD